MKHLILNRLVVLILVSFLLSFSKTDDYQTVARLNVTPQSMRLDYREVNDSSLNVISDVPWSAETNAKWIKLDKEKGEGSCRLNIVVSPNIESEGRSASVIFKAQGEKPVTVVIFQKALHEE